MSEVFRWCAFVAGMIFPSLIGINANSSVSNATDYHLSMGDIKKVEHTLHLSQNICTSEQEQMYNDCQNKNLSVFYQESGACYNMKQGYQRDTCIDNAHKKQTAGSAMCVSKYPGCSGASS